MRCTFCGKFLKIAEDSYTPFGAQGPENLDPLDEEFVCKKCWPGFKQSWIEYFKGGFRYGDYQKSRAERQAAKECKLVWIDGVSNWPGGKDPSYEYVSRKDWLLHELITR